MNVEGTYVTFNFNLLSHMLGDFHSPIQNQILLLILVKTDLSLQCR